MGDNQENCLKTVTIKSCLYSTDDLPVQTSQLITFTQKSSDIDNFIKVLQHVHLGDELLVSEMQNNRGHSLGSSTPVSAKIF